MTLAARLHYRCAIRTHNNNEAADRLLARCPEEKRWPFDPLPLDWSDVRPTSWRVAEVAESPSGLWGGQERK